MFHKDMRSLNLHAPSIEHVEVTGSNIAKLQVVALNDAMGTKFPQVIVGSPGIRPNFGIAIAAIADGAEGRVQTIGFLDCVDTSAFSAGDTLYSDASGFLTTTVNGTEIARVIVVGTTDGVLYINAIGGSGAGGGFPSWEIDGNNGTDEDLNFLGTTDTQGIQTKTNNVNAMFISATQEIAFGQHKPDGFIHYKNHTGFEGSGKILDTGAIATTDTSYNLIYSKQVPDMSTIIVKASVVGIEDGNVGRGTFVRTASFFRQGISANQEGSTQTGYTFKSKPGLNVRFSISGDEFQVEVKGDSVLNTRWNANIEIDVIKNP